VEAQSQSSKKMPILYFTCLQQTALSSVLSTTLADVILSSKRKSLILSLKGSTLKKPVFPCNDLIAALWYSAGRANQQLFPWKAQIRKARVPLQWPFLLLYSHLPFIISLLMGLEEKCIRLKLGKSSVTVRFTGGV